MLKELAIAALLESAMQGDNDYAVLAEDLLSILNDLSEDESNAQVLVRNPSGVYKVFYNYLSQLGCTDLLGSTDCALQDLANFALDAYASENCL